MKILVPALILALMAVSSHAAEITAPTEGVTQQVEMQGLADQITTLRTRITSATTRLFKIKECHNADKFFRQLPDGTEGCVDPISPTTP